MLLFEKLKARLAAEGLFAPERKKKLPSLPRTIGVVTSPTGAVIRDILHRLADRFPTHVIVWPVLVQGEGSAAQIARAVSGFSAMPQDGPATRPDLVIVARGGGSIEDLWAFNDEAVVRAVADCTIPIISAVGHETDTTLCDFAADLRAPTPTAAAEIAVPVRSDLLQRVGQFGLRMSNTVRKRVDLAAERLEAQRRLMPKTHRRSCRTFASIAPHPCRQSRDCLFSASHDASPTLIEPPCGARAAKVRCTYQAGGQPAPRSAAKARVRAGDRRRRQNHHDA